MPEHSGAGEEPQSDNNKSTEPSWQSLDSNALIEALTKEVRELREVLKGQLAQVVKKDPPTKLETRQQVATILGVPIAILGFLITALAFLLAAYTFTYTGEMQAEDAANRAIQEHMKVRSDMGSSMSGLVAELRTYPERLAEKDTEVFTQYDSVADHGLATVEWIYRMRVTRSAIQEPLWIEKPLEQVGLRSTDPNADWRSSAEGWIWEYRAAIYAGMAEGSFGESNF